MRDPRRDPVVGDVVFKGAGWRRVEFTSDKGRFASTVTHVNHNGVNGRIALASWRNWCRGATLEPIPASTSEDQGLRMRFVELEERVRIAEERVLRLERLIGSGEGIGIDTL